MTEIVLIGGGHAHLFVLEAFAKKPLAGVSVTLIAKEAFAPYSGMLPGRVSGQYPIDAGEIDLTRLADRAGARLLHTTATMIDRSARTIVVDGGPPVPYDLLSLDLGIVPDVSAIDGAAENGLIVKPISTFRQKLDDLLSGIADGRIRDLVVVGGGPAGFELAHALMRRAKAASCGHEERRVTITLAAGRHLLSGLPERGRRLARRSLREAGIILIEGQRTSRIDPDAVVFDDGRTLAADGVLVSTAAAAPGLLRSSGLAVDDAGFLMVRPTLQASDDDRLFAAGDCVTLIGQERPKAGVFAVRQGPIIAENLRRAVLARPLRRYRAQNAYLMLLALANGEAIAARGGWAFQSRLAFWLKDWIDRGFVDRFHAPDKHGTAR